MVNKNPKIKKIKQKAKPFVCINC